MCQDYLVGEGSNVQANDLLDGLLVAGGTGRLEKSFEELTGGVIHSH